MRGANKSDEPRGRVYTGIWRGKWIFEGARSLDEVISNLEGAVAELRAMRDDGVELVGSVEDDHGLLTTTDPTVAARYGLQEEADDEDEEDAL